MGAPGATVRVQAAQVLDAVAHRGTSLKAALATALPTLADPRDRALLEAICFGALRGAARYDRALAAWIPRPLPRRDASLRALLHVGFAQLDPLGLPAHAALSATVEAARAMGRSHQAGLVNALLRRAQRDGLPPPAPGDGWPAWLLAQVREDWPDAWEAILEASASQAPTWLRVNRRRSTPAACIAALAEAGVEAVAFPGLPDALRVDAPFAVAALPGFTGGLFSVQDGSAQQVAAALAPAPGARVLDACAAPGGKSAHLLERDPALRLTALDVAAPRVARIAATFARLGVGEQASLRTVDALEVGRWWDGTPFDAVLLDAPCSATGVVRRQPDVLLHRRASDLEALVALQARLLDALAPTVAPGGVLLYATCSILRRENAAQVEAFLARHPDFAVQPLDAGFGRDTGAGHQRLPGEDGMDGFFYARLRRGH